MSSIYMFKFRYKMHQMANGDDAMPYDEWCDFIRTLGYTVPKLLMDYQPWKPWRWAVLDHLKVGNFLRTIWRMMPKLNESQIEKVRKVFRCILTILILIAIVVVIVGKPMAFLAGVISTILIASLFYIVYSLLKGIGL